MSDTSINRESEAIERRAYAQPKLVAYGAMAVLTAGGSINNLESGFIQNGQCSNSPNRRC